MQTPPETAIRWTRTCRLIPTRYPSVGLFDRVSSPEDLDAILELESWTNDRISTELGLLHRLPREEWVVGRPMASVVMAAFCHPRPGGGRFSSAERGAWYCGRTVATALAESVYHRTRDLEEVGHFETRMQVRLFHADFRASFPDVRAPDRAFTRFHRSDDYGPPQALARELLERGSNGVVYRSVRHEGGECLACFRPALVANVRVGTHYEFRWEGTPTPRIIPIRES